MLPGLVTALARSARILLPGAAGTAATIAAAAIAVAVTSVATVATVAVATVAVAAPLVSRGRSTVAMQALGHTVCVQSRWLNNARGQEHAGRLRGG